VDTRSVLDKLLDQGRTLDIVNGAFVVADIPEEEPEPEPEPEPQPEPEPEPEPEIE
jgi:hypothetical protein